MVTGAWGRWPIVHPSRLGRRGAHRTAYKWLARHRHGGVAALADRSAQPHRQPRRTSPSVVSAIVAARHERLTAWAIAVRVQVPRSTVAAILARLGLNKLAALEP